MAEDLLITRMTSDDIDDVVLLDRSIFYDPWARTSFSGSLKKDTCLILRRDGELEGYAIFSSIFDEGELLRIAVNPLSRRKGYATMLMNELSKLGRERNIEHWFLEVRAGNLGAIKLYEKFGFILPNLVVGKTRLRRLHRSTFTGKELFCPTINQTAFDVGQNV